jgi:hypothetical protein
MIQNFFLALTLLMAAPRAPGVEITFTDGGAGGRITRYRVPLPLENQSTRLHFWESEPGGRQEISLNTRLVKDKSGASWLDYEIKRQAGGRPKDAPAADVDVAGAVGMPTTGPVTVGEWVGTHGPTTVRVEIVQP